MKFLEHNTPLERINLFLSDSSPGESTAKRNLEAFSCKHIGPDRKLSLSLEHEEPTMAEKLAGLDDGEEKNITRQEPYPTVAPPSADSVHVLLKQALRADDHSLLLDCLYMRDEKVITKSISLLTPADVLKLLKSLLPMLQSRGGIAVCVLQWIRSLLSQHASSIVSQESSLLLLYSLYQLVESRTWTFGSALELSTCLDHLFTGIPDDEAVEDSTIIYEDKDSSDESEDAMETDNDGDGYESERLHSPHDSDGSTT